jgi:hypothetical protein
MTGLLKTKGVSDDYIKLIAKDWVEDSRFIKNYVTRGDKLTKSELLKKGYSSTAADEIIKAANNSKKFQDALKGGGKVKPTPPKPSGSGGISSWFSKWFSSGKNKPKINVNTNKVGDWLSKRWKTFSTVRKVLMLTSLAALGYVGFTVYDYIQAFLGINPLPDLDDQDAPQSVKDWKKCIDVAVQTKMFTNLELENVKAVQMALAKKIIIKEQALLKCFESLKKLKKFGIVI